MGILNSIVVGKARNKAGAAVFYTRMGVPCFREKAVLSKNRSYTATQLAQQKVYKFFKANIDNYGIMPVVNTLFDQKASGGKGQTVYNLFYKAFLPHVQAQRDDIAALEDDELINPNIFFMQPEGFNDRLIEGVLGTSGAELVTSGASSAARAVNLNMSALAVQGLLEKANSKLTAKDTLFTIENIFVGSVYWDGVKNGDAKVVMPKKAGQSGESSIASFSVVSNTNNNGTCYALIAVGYPDTSGNLDTSKKFYSADSLYIETVGQDGPSVE